MHEMHCRYSLWPMDAPIGGLALPPRPRARHGPLYWVSASAAKSLGLRPAERSRLSPAIVAAMHIYAWTDREIGGVGGRRGHVVGRARAGGEFIHR